MVESLRQLYLNAEVFYDQNLNESKSMVIPIYSFLDQLISNIKKYINSKAEIYDHAHRVTVDVNNWAEFLLGSYTYKNFNSIYFSWKKYCKNSLELQLISTLLYVPVRYKGKLSLFLKLRKNCLNANTIGKILDDLPMSHQEIIGVVHNTYSKADERKQVINGIKRLFISYKVTNAKICSPVFIEFALSLYTAQHQRNYEEAAINFESSIIKNSLQHMSNVTSKQPPDSQFYSSIHEQNGLYRKKKYHNFSIPTSSQGYQVIDRKFVEQRKPKYFQRSKDNAQSRYGSKNYEYRHFVKEKQQQSHFDSRNYRVKNQEPQIRIEQEGYYKKMIGSYQKSQTPYLSPEKRSRDMIIQRYSPDSDGFIRSNSPQHDESYGTSSRNYYRPLQFEDSRKKQFQHNIHQGYQPQGNYIYDANQSSRLMNQNNIEDIQPQNSFNDDTNRSSRLIHRHSIENDQIHQQSTHIKQRERDIAYEENSGIIIHRLSGSKSKKKMEKKEEMKRIEEMQARHSFNSDLIFSEDSPRSPQIHINDSLQKKDLFKISHNSNSPHFEFDVQRVQQESESNLKQEENNQYESWNKMVEHNKQFKQKMLSNSYNGENQKPKSNVNIIRATAPKGRHYNCVYP